MLNVPPQFYKHNVMGKPGIVREAGLKKLSLLHFALKLNVFETGKILCPPEPACEQ